MSAYCEHGVDEQVERCYYCDLRWQENIREREPSITDLCAGTGHKYHGEDQDGGRCYCGEKRYA